MSSNDTPEEYNEAMELVDALDEFTDLMETRLIEKHDAGYRGWGSATEESKDLGNGLLWLSGKQNFLNGMRRSIEQRSWVDVANWAMFIWNLEQKEEPCPKNSK